MSVKLQLTQSFTTHETPQGDDIAAPQLSLDGKHLVLYYNSFNNIIGDNPTNAFTIFPIKNDKIDLSSPLYSYKYGITVANGQYLIASFFSPDLKRFIIGTVPQIYPPPTSTSLLGTTDNSYIFQYTGAVPPPTSPDYEINSGPNGNYTFDVTLTLYEFDCDFTATPTQVSQIVLNDIYLGGTLLGITWYMDPRYIVLRYNTSLVPNNESTSSNLEVRDTFNDLALVSTGQTLLNTNVPETFRLEGDDRLFFVMSGCAFNNNPASQQIVGSPVIEGASPPCYIEVFDLGVSGPNKGNITSVDQVYISAFTRGLDVRVCKDEALIISTGRVPVKPHCPSVYTEVVQLNSTELSYPGGVQDAIVQGSKHFSDTSTVQLVRFRDNKLTVAERLSTHKPQSFTPLFIPRTDTILINSDFQVGDGYIDNVLFRLSYKKECCHYLHPYDVYNPCPAVANTTVSHCPEGQLVISAGAASDNLNTNLGTGVNNVMVFKVVRLDCDEQ